MRTWRLRPTLCECVLDFTLDESLEGDEREASVQLIGFVTRCDRHRLMDRLQAHARIREESRRAAEIVAIAVDVTGAEPGRLAAAVSVDRDGGLRLRGLGPGFITLLRVPLAGLARVQ